MRGVHFYSSASALRMKSILPPPALRPMAAMDSPSGEIARRLPKPVSMSFGPKHGREFGAQNPHGNLALVFQIHSEVNGRHAAFAKMALDPVAVGEGSGEEQR